MASHLLFNSGSNESSLAPQFKWLDNTFKPNFGGFFPKLEFSRGFLYTYIPSSMHILFTGRNSEAAMGGKARSAPFGVAINPKRRVRAAHGRAHEAKTH
jgi:hypothetical protein